MGIEKSIMSVADTNMIIVAAEAAKVLNLNAFNTHDTAEATVTVYGIPFADVFVNNVVVDSAGSGYTNVPTVDIAGPADGTARMKVASAAVTSGGSNYAVGNTLTLNLGGGTVAAATLTVTSVGAGGAITGLSVASAGQYSAVQATGVSPSGGAGTGAVVSLTFNVHSVVVTAPGSGYNQAPAVTFGNGNAVARAVLAPLVEDRHIIEKAKFSGLSGRRTQAVALSKGDMLVAKATTANVAFSAWGVTAL